MYFENVVLRDCTFESTLTANVTTPMFDYDSDNISRNISIENCSFLFNGTTGVGKAVVLLDVRNDVCLVGCRFAVTADSSAGGGSISLLILDSNDATTDLRGRVVRNCTFRGCLTNAAVQKQCQGLEIGALNYLWIDGCTFDYLNAGIVCPTGTIPGHHRIQHCLLRNCDTTCYLQSLSGSGLRFLYNRVYHGTTGVYGLVQIEGSTTLYDVEFVGNYFSNCEVRLTSTETIRRLHVQSNDFVGLSDCPAPYIRCGTVSGSIEDAVITGNTFAGFDHSTVADTYVGLYVGSTVAYLRDVVINDNTFRDLLNMSYSGADALSATRVIELRFFNCYNVSVSGNRGYNIMSGASGNNHWCPVFLQCGRGVTGPSWIESLKIADNEVCDPTQNVDFLQVLESAGTSLHIHGNQFSTDYAGAATYPRHNSTVVLNLSDADVSVLDIRDNEFSIFGSVEIGENVITIICGNLISLFLLLSNMFWAQYSGGWGLTSSYPGIDMQSTTVSAFMFRDNAAHSGGASGVVSTFGTNFASSVFTTINDSITPISKPSAGTKWDHNIDITSRA
jgi:hypothetical protein